MKWGCTPRSSAAARSRRSSTSISNEAHHGFSLPDAFDVDFNKRAEIDASNMSSRTQVNLRIRELMQDGYGTIVIKNPGRQAFDRGRHPATGCNLIIDGSLGYFGLRPDRRAERRASPAASAGRAPRT